MDGLLLDSERQIYVHSGLLASQKVGRPLSMDFLTRRMGGSWITYEEKLKEEYGEDYPVKEYWEEYWKIANEIIENKAIDLRPGVRKVLDYCKKEGIPMAIASSSSHHVINRCLSNAKIIGYFDCLVSAQDVRYTKPDPEIFLKALSHFSLPAAEAIIFEDGHNGAQAAIRCGCRFILGEDLAYLSEEDKEKAVMVVDDISKAIPYLKQEKDR